MCSGSHAQTAGTCGKRKKSCPKCGNTKLEKVRRALIEAKPQIPDEMVWYCSKCSWHEAVE